MNVSLPSPALQIEFGHALVLLRRQYLQEALRRTVRTTDIVALDKELAAYAEHGHLAALAAAGLRGELVFAVPLLLRANPKLLAYYRLLLGFSQKEFYRAAYGTSCLKAMEDTGRLTVAAATRIADTCRALNVCACQLLDGLGIHAVTKAFLDDLTLLTLGPQLRGGANVARGEKAIKEVFGVIHEIVKSSVVTASTTTIVIRNAADRTVRIEFSADPDIVIFEDMHDAGPRNVIAIEVKGGTDFSNIHNRVGEAEKSHQKARQKGFVECWTVVNVLNFDMVMAKRESPSTNRFYSLADLLDASSAPYADFRARVVSLTGIKGPSKET